MTKCVVAYRSRAQIASQSFTSGFCGQRTERNTCSQWTPPTTTCETTKLFQHEIRIWYKPTSGRTYLLCISGHIARSLSSSPRFLLRCHSKLKQFFHFLVSTFTGNMFQHWKHANRPPSFHQFHLSSLLAFLSLWLTRVSRSKHSWQFDCKFFFSIWKITFCRSIRAQLLLLLLRHKGSIHGLHLLGIWMLPIFCLHFGPTL
jgi:hypothetical protein